jgi:hypothetical protein
MIPKSNLVIYTNTNYKYVIAKSIKLPFLSPEADVDPAFLPRRLKNVYVNSVFLSEGQTKR